MNQITKIAPDGKSLKGKYWPDGKAISSRDYPPYWQKGKGLMAVIGIRYEGF